MWYFDPEKAPLSLFSSSVFHEEKKLIVEVMANGDDWSVRGIKCPMSSM